MSDGKCCKHSELKQAAKNFYEEGDYKEAQKLYERILDENYNDVQTLCNLAKVYFKMGNFKNAVKIVNAAIRVNPCYDIAYHIWAKVAEKEGDLDECIRILELGMEKCEDSDLLEDYYDEAIEAKAEKDLQLDLLESSLRKKLENKAADSKKDMPAKKNTLVNDSKTPSKSTKPSRPPTLADDCPDLVSDSDSSSENEAPKVAKSGKTMSRKVSETSFHHEDEFMKTVLTVAKEKNLTYEDVANNRIQKFKTLCKEGSEAYLEGIHRKSIDKYKEAYDLVDDLPLDLFKISEIDFAVLKYILCLLRVKSANYENVVSAIQTLKELEENQSRTLPCVYYLLGVAYQTLNRNKHAVEVGEKGLSFLEKGIQFESQPYPQVYEVIPETTKEDLQTKLEQLINNCRIYRQPDAVCRYSRCHSVNSHIIPSCNIYYSDPDFTGYVSAICEEHCKICFHLNCWRSWKEGIADGRKVTDKDVLGLDCFTEDCETDSKQHSKIIQIDITGIDGQVKSSVKGAPKTDKSAVKKDKRTESISLDKEPPAKKEKKTESAPAEKPTSESVAPKEKVDKCAGKKQKKTAEPAPAKPKNNNNKDLRDDNEDLVKIDTPATHVDLAPKLNKLKKLREINYGYTNSGDLDPEKMDYGINMDSSEPIDFGISVPDKECSCTLEFILSMFYGFLRSEGPQKKSEVLKKWEEEKQDLDPNLYVHTNYKGICELLLQSYHFCQVGSFIAISKQVHVAHKLMEKEYEHCKQKATKVSESEDYHQDHHLYEDSDHFDPKSFPSDTFASTVLRTKQTANTIHLSPSNKKSIPFSENKSVSNNNIPINNRNYQTNFNSVNNKNFDIDIKNETNANKAPSVGKNPSENIKNNSQWPALNAKTQDSKKSKVAPAPEIALHKEPVVKVPTQPRQKLGISRDKLTELLSSKFDKKNEDHSKSDEEFEEINIRKLKKATKLNVPKKNEEQVDNSQQATPIETFNPFIKAISKTVEVPEKKEEESRIRESEEEDKDFGCINIKRSGLRSKIGLSRDKNVQEESTRRRRILDCINSHLESNDVKENEKVTGNIYDFPVPKEVVDLKQDETATTANIQSPVPAFPPENVPKTRTIEYREISCQTVATEEKKVDHEKLLESYKQELEEWKEKNKNLELMLVEAYSTNAELTEELEDLKEKSRKDLVESTAAMKMMDDTIQELKKTVESNEANEKLAKSKADMEELTKAYKKSETELAELKEQLKEITDEKMANISEELKSTEEFVINVMRDYGQLLLKFFKEKAAEKIEILDMAESHTTDETEPSKNQVLLVKKKWVEARTEVSTKVREYKKKLDLEHEKLKNGEELDDLQKMYSKLSVFLTVQEDLFDPIPALTAKLLDDVNKLASIVMQHVPTQILTQMNLRNMLVDRSRLQQGPPKPPQQIFFPVYQPRAMAPPGPQGYMPQQPRMPPPPFPVIDKKYRSPSESSVRSNVSDQSESSSISISDFSEQSSSSEVSAKSKTSKKKKKASNNSVKSNETAEGQKEITNGISRSPSSSVLIDKSSSSLKPVASTLTAVNNAAYSSKSTLLSPKTLKLLAFLKKQIQNVSETDLEKCLTAIRRNNQGSLTGLSLDALIEKVRIQLKLRNTNTLGYVKYSGPAWGTVKEEDVNWKKNEAELADCVICFEKLSGVNYVQLSCKHEFHETCIKKWFKEMTVCPTCKRRCLLQDEYPPLQ